MYVSRPNAFGLGEVEVLEKAVHFSAIRASRCYLCGAGYEIAYSKYESTGIEEGSKLAAYIVSHNASCVYMWHAGIHGFVTSWNKFEKVG